MAVATQLQDLRFKRGAVVVATGGHLEQAIRRVDQLGLNSTVTFFVPRNSQSETRLHAFKHNFVAKVGSRDFLGFIKVAFQLMFIMNKRKYDYVLSTGAGVAIACRIVCKLKGLDFIYIESIARQSSPSMTGRILVQMRTKNLYTESDSFDPTQWLPIDSLFAQYRSYDRNPEKYSSDPLKIFVTAGTVHDFEFRRLVDLVDAVTNESDHIVWQIGFLESVPLQGKVFKELSATEFEENLKKADVVISHAGVGSILNILDIGKFPILIPRKPEYNEHIDNHQLEIATLLRNLDLCTVVTENLQRSDLIYAHLKGVRPSRDL